MWPNSRFAHRIGYHMRSSRGNVSVCFWTPRLLLGHPGFLRSVHDLKCICTQTAPVIKDQLLQILFSTPFKRYPIEELVCVSFDEIRSSCIR